MCVFRSCTQRVHAAELPLSLLMKSLFFFLFFWLGSLNITSPSTLEGSSVFLNLFYHSSKRQKSDHQEGAFFLINEKIKAEHQLLCLRASMGIKYLLFHLKATVALPCTSAGIEHDRLFFLKEGT